MTKRTPEDRARSEEIGRRLRERVARIEAELTEKARDARPRRRRLFGLLAL
jgi:3-phenylpropionate/cinnamic acid dioxygenase small subunit